MQRPSPGAMSLGLHGIVGRLRSTSSVVIGLVSTVLIAAFLLGAAPRLLTLVSEQDLRATVTDPLPTQRNLRVERASLPTVGPPDDPFGSVRRSGETFASVELPESVKSILSDQYFVVESPQFSMTALPGEKAPHPFDMFVRFRYQERIEENARLVAGRMPEPRDRVTMLVGGDCPSETAERERLAQELATEGETSNEDFDCRPADVPAYEVAVTQETLETLGIALDEQMLLTPDPSDPLLFSLPGQALGYPVVVSISGVIELTDDELEYWFGDPGLRRPSIEETADFRIIFATGLISPDAFRDLISTTGDAYWAQTWRFLVAPDLIVDADLDVLEDDLRRLLIEFSPISTLPSEMRIFTQLARLLTEHEEQRQQTVAMLSLATSGLFGVSTAVLLLLAVLMTDRQRHSIILTRNRGASRAQLLMTRLFESLFLVTPPAVLGYALAVWLLPDGDDLLTYRAVVAISVVAIVLLLLSGLPLFTRRLGALQGSETASSDRTGRRWVFEILAVVVAVGAILVLRRRGQADAASDRTAFDALLAATPLVIALVAGVLVLRLFPLVVRALAKVSSYSRGGVAFVGFRRLVRRPTGQNLSMVVLVFCVATAALASITANSISNGQQISSWQTVGADYAIQGFRVDANIPSRVDIRTLAGPGAMGRSYSRTRVETESGIVNVDVLAIEIERYQQLATGTPGAIALPPRIREGAAGTPEDPIPVIVSATWPGEVKPGPDDRLELDLGRLRPVGVVVESRETFPGIPPGRPFLIADLTTLATISDLPLPPTVTYLRGPESVEGSLRADLSEQSQSARLFSRYDLLEEFRRDPFVAWSTVALDIAFWFAVGIGALAAISALALSTAARRRDFGYLRTIGVDDGQATTLTVIEQLPGVVVGTAAGIGAGALTALFLAPSIVLDGFTGNVIPTRLVVDWSQILILAIVLVGALSLASGIFVLMNRHDNVGRVLRLGDVE